MSMLYGNLYSKTQLLRPNLYYEERLLAPCQCMECENAHLSEGICLEHTQNLQFPRGFNPFLCVQPWRHSIWGIRFAKVMLCSKLMSIFGNFGSVEWTLDQQPQKPEKRVFLGVRNPWPITIEVRASTMRATNPPLSVHFILAILCHAVILLHFFLFVL